MTEIILIPIIVYVISLEKKREINTEIAFFSATISLIFRDYNCSSTLVKGTQPLPASPALL
jgi:hypothetical protein